MLVVGLNGSPRRKGNTRFLLDTFLRRAAELGARTRTVEVARAAVQPCRELVVCEKKGYCPLVDDVQREIYPLLRRAEVVLLASPIFFYNMTAQLKAVVDRCQMFWARKYRLKLSDPAKRVRRGFVLSVGATEGKNLFEGLLLTARYFFDAIDARYAGELTFRGIEGPGDLAARPGVEEEIAAAADRLLAPLLRRVPVLFAGRRNACRSQMAAAWAQFLAGDRLAVTSGGSHPAEELDPEMVRVMQAAGIDMVYRRPAPLEAALAEAAPQLVVTFDDHPPAALPPGARRVTWQVPDPAGGDAAQMQRASELIRTRVEALASEL